MTGNPGPLSGIRVLDLSRVMSGPFCTSMLADLGAEVIKVEMPVTGEESRSFGPYKNGESTYFMLLNRNKQSLTVDMKSKDGQAVVRTLVCCCDVLVENFRPGVMARLGLDEPAVRAINPGIVYTSISGFGQESPLKNWPAFDLVIQAMGGLMSLTGQKGGTPTAVGESIADVCTGMFAAFGTVAALLERERTKQGAHVDVAMLDSLFAMQLTGLARQLYMNETPRPVGNRHPVTYPVDSFSTRTGDIVLVCFSDFLFAELAQIIGEPQLAQDERFRTNAARNEHEDLLREKIAVWASGLDQDTAIEALIAAGIPAAPVWNLKQLAESSHVRERNLIVEGHSSALGNVPLVPQPVKFSTYPGRQNFSTPTLGEHTQSVLRDIAGMSDAEIDALRAKKVI